MVANEHNRNDESHKGRIGICIFCIEQDQECKKGNHFSGCECDDDTYGSSGDKE